MKQLRSSFISDAAKEKGLVDGFVVFFMCFCLWFTVIVQLS